MTEHTPGPWDVEDPMENSLWIVPGGKPTYEWWPIAVCSMPDEDDHLFTGAEVRANAALIARAPDLLAEVTRLRAVNAGLVEALKIAEAQFGFYGLSHRAKGTPDADAKAETNEKLVETMSAALRAAEETTNAPVA